MMEFHRSNGSTAVTVPDAVADEAGCSKLTLQPLPLVRGPGHSQRLVRASCMTVAMTLSTTETQPQSPPSGGRSWMAAPAGDPRLPLEGVGWDGFDPRLGEPPRAGDQNLPLRA